MKNKTRGKVSLLIMLAMVLSMFQGFALYTREVKASSWSAVSNIAIQGNNGSRLENEYSSNSAGAKLGSYGSGKVKCYTLAGSGRVYAYNDAALQNRNVSRYIDCATDEVYVQAVNIAYGSVLLSYPVSGGRRSMYFRLSDIMTNPGSRPYSFYANHKIITYRRASAEKEYGYIQNEEAVAVGTSGGFTQIIYSIGFGNYKMGFIRTADIESTENVSSGNSGQTTDVSGLARKIVDYELSQVGVGDYKGNNNVSYNTWYYGRTVNGSGYAWCMAFQAYSANQFGVLNTAIPRTASCTQAVNWYKSRGQFHYSKSYGGNYIPKAGDLVFYYDTSSKSICHVGMIISAPVNGYLQTVEGNILCSDGNWKVQKFTKNAKRTVNHSYVYGYASPAY